MAEAARPRPIEYRSPRPLILGLCFFWGIGVGFALNFFRPQDATLGRETANAGQTVQVVERAGPSELERRRLDTPNISDVAPATASSRPTLETMSIDPPAAVLTTDGGLTGRTAPMPYGVSPRPAPAPAPTPPPRPAAPAAPPPLPDLRP